MAEIPLKSIHRKVTPDKLYKGVHLKKWFLAMCISSLLVAAGCVVGGSSTPCITTYRATEARVTLTALAVENIKDATEHPGALEAAVLTQMAAVAQRPVNANCKSVDELATYAAGTIQAIGTKGVVSGRTASAATVTKEAERTEDFVIGQTLKAVLATGISATATIAFEETMFPLVNTAIAQTQLAGTPATPDPLALTLESGMSQTAAAATPSPGK